MRGMYFSTNLISVNAVNHPVCRCPVPNRTPAILKCGVPVVVCIVIVSCSLEVAPLEGIGLTTKLILFLTSIATPPPCLFGLSAQAIGW